MYKAAQRIGLIASWTCVALCGLDAAGARAAGPELNPVVEIEEDVYKYEPADNGAGPTWCSGSSCLVRIGDEVFASGLETITNAKPLNNCRWTLYQSGPSG